MVLPFRDFLFPQIARSGANADIGSVDLNSYASEFPVEIKILRAVGQTVDGAQLRGDLLEDAVQILDSVRVVESPA